MIRNVGHNNAKIQFAGKVYICIGKDNRMQKITLPFLNCKSPVPVICLPLIGGQQICALVDTGAEISLYDKEAKETNPDLFVSSKHLGVSSGRLLAKLAVFAGSLLLF